jgi:hypothetical protein
MTFSGFAVSLLGVLFLLAGLPGSATAEDKQTSPEQSLNPTQNELFALENNSPRSRLSALTSPFSYSDASSGVLRLRDLQPEGRSLADARADANGDVCYTMRSYKVKRTERLADNSSALRGYSTCEMASSYHVRSADGQAKKQK